MNYNVADVEKIEIILKITERCNINCDYCYFFYGGDQSYKLHPKYIGIDTVRNIASFIVEGIKGSNIKEVQIDFHGGEPLMLNRKSFDKVCEIFTAEISPHAKLELALQTNATLINDAWIELFAKHDVQAGVSLDGPKVYNDKHRLDHKGKSTYDRVVRGIRLLQQGNKEGKFQAPGVLSVINPNFDGRKIYRHFIDELGFEQIDFLLPDENHDSISSINPEELGCFLIDVFDEWTKDDNSQIYIRFLRSFMDKLLGRRSLFFKHSSEPVKHVAFTIASNGNIAVEDTLRTTLFWDPSKERNVDDISLLEFLDSDLMRYTINNELSVPSHCADCCWVKACGGGSLVNRYSESNAFDNPTIWCAGLKPFYSRVFNYMLRSGFSFDEMAQAMGLSNRDVA